MIPRWAVALLAGAALAVAEDDLVSVAVGEFDSRLIDTDRAGFYFDITDADGRERAVEVRAEYRPGFSALRLGDPFILRPVVGAAATSDAALYLHTGLAFDFTAGPVVFTPSFGPGLFTRGQGKNLGYPLEYRTMFELGWRFPSGLRITGAFSHMSNDGLGAINPGSNSLLVYVYVEI